VVEVSPSSRSLFKTSGADATARKTYDLIDEPVGSDYDALIESALGQCSTAVLIVRGDELEASATALLRELRPHLLGVRSLPRGDVHRYGLNRDSAARLKAAARGLYAWLHPALPEDLSLLRRDGSPWLVSIASERLGYLELAPFEKLLLGRAAPGLAAVLAHQATRDANLAFFERSLEASQDQLVRELSGYGRGVVEEGREGVVLALADWLASQDDTRVAVALEVAMTLGLPELRSQIRGMHHALVTGETEVPLVYRSNLVLRERWKARRRRQLDRALEQLGG